MVLHRGAAGQRCSADASIELEEQRSRGQGRPAHAIGQQSLSCFGLYGTETVVLSPELVMVKVPEAVEV